jgi:hypothetical protein
VAEAFHPKQESCSQRNVWPFCLRLYVPAHAEGVMGKRDATLAMPSKSLKQQDTFEENRKRCNEMHITEVHEINHGGAGGVVDV